LRAGVPQALGHGLRIEVAVEQGLAERLAVHYANLLAVDLDAQIRAAHAEREAGAGARAPVLGVLFAPVQKQLLKLDHTLPRAAR